MNEEQASEASRLLLALARRNARVYAAHPDARAIIVTGSAAEGVSDFSSDLDMILYYARLPSEDELLAACQQNEGKGRHQLPVLATLGYPLSSREVNSNVGISGVLSLLVIPWRYSGVSPAHHQRKYAPRRSRHNAKSCPPPVLKEMSRYSKHGA